MTGLPPILSFGESAQLKSPAIINFSSVNSFNSWFSFEKTLIAAEHH